MRQYVAILPIYEANYLAIGRYAPLFHARGFASGILIYRFGCCAGVALPSSIVARTYIVYSTLNLIWQGYALLENRKYVLSSSHFMFATLALRSIKCVNRNLLGNLEFQIATTCRIPGNL
jgi:hypothetical protein